jgi:hypothetical protein
MVYKSFHPVILLADYHPLHTAEDNPVLLILKVQKYLSLHVINYCPILTQQLSESGVESLQAASNWRLSRWTVLG